MSLKYEYARKFLLMEISSFIVCNLTVKPKSLGKKNIFLKQYFLLKAFYLVLQSSMTSAKYELTTYLGREIRDIFSLAK